MEVDCCRAHTYSFLIESSVYQFLKEETDRPWVDFLLMAIDGLFNGPIFLSTQTLHPLVFLLMDRMLLLRGVIIEYKQEQA